MTSKLPVYRESITKDSKDAHRHVPVKASRLVGMLTAGSNAMQEPHAALGESLQNSDCAVGCQPSRLIEVLRLSTSDLHG